jgi:HEPN domain-containing protein
MLTPEAKNKLIGYWRRGSDEDFKTATAMFDHTDRYASALFFLHLSLERALKALFVAKFGEHAPFTHSLLSLVEKLSLSVTEPDRMTLATINDFNLESRYPDEKYSLMTIATQAYTAKYYSETGRLRAWIFETLKNLPSS